MTWKLITYTKVYLPVEPYQSTYAIGIVENEKGERKTVRIPAKYFGKLKTGIEGEVEVMWTVFGEVTYFKPRIELDERKVVFVTGGARGIGAAIAIEFAKHGYGVAIGDIAFDEEAEKTVNIIKSLNAEVLFVKVDVSKYNEVENAVKEIISKLGRIDVLVNNAGITRDTYLQRMDEGIWDQVINVNLKSAFNCSKAVVPYMIEQGGGVIINMSSIVGLVGNIGQVNYAASKAGLIGLTRTLAKELASYGIRVIAIAPGFVKTRMTLAIPINILRDYMKRIPIRRLIEPEEVAKLVYHVVENEALNGVVIPIDLGLTIASPRAN